MNIVTSSISLFCVVVGLWSTGNANELEEVFYGVGVEQLLDRKGIIFNRTKCIDELGCFSTGGDFFHLLHRPLNLLPDDRAKIDTRFYLYTRNHSKEDLQIRPNEREVVNNSDFSSQRQTKFIVHGFVDKLDYELEKGWMKKLKDGLLANGDYNVFIVDWSEGNTFPYLRAVANTRVVGAEIAHFIKKLQEWKGLDLKDVHIIGHSLGAHVAGYAGERLDKINRITGLDPAGPFFENMPPRVRLDRSDAEFVDVVHTDSDSLLGLGIRSAIGHVDFYPNDGVQQPGCEKMNTLMSLKDGLIIAGKRLLMCHHQRSVDLFYETLMPRSSCRMIGHVCKDWKTFEIGSCDECGAKGENCDYLGINADHFKRFAKNDSSVSMYLRTGNKEPYCLYAYKILVVVSDDSEGTTRDERGTMHVTLHGTKGEDFTLEITNGPEIIYAGGIFTKIVSTEKELGNIPFITFQWKQNSRIISPSTWSLFRKPTLQISTIKIMPINSIHGKEAQQGTKRFCGKGKAILSGEKVPFIVNGGC